MASIKVKENKEVVKLSLTQREAQALFDSLARVFGSIETSKIEDAFLEAGFTRDWSATEGRIDF